MPEKGEYLLTVRYTNDPQLVGGVIAEGDSDREEVQRMRTSTHERTGLRVFLGAIIVVLVGLVLFVLAAQIP
jgi:hypothetical protein